MTTTEKALRRMMEDIKQDLTLVYAGELQSENPIDLWDYFKNVLGLSMAHGDMIGQKFLSPQNYLRRFLRCSLVTGTTDKGGYLP